MGFFFYCRSLMIKNSTINPTLANPSTSTQSFTQSTQSSTQSTLMKTLSSRSTLSSSRSTSAHEEKE